MNEVIERLKSENAEEQAATIAEGHAFGTDWAKSTASPKELRRIERFMSGSNLEDVFATIDSYQVVGIIDSDESPDRTRVDEFWECVLGDSANDDQLQDVHFLRAFVEGAAELWDQVKASI